MANMNFNRIIRVGLKSVLAIVLVTIATMIRNIFFPILQETPYIIFFPAIIILALYGGFRQGLFITVLSAVAASLTQSAGRIHFDLPGHWAGMFVFLVGNIIISGVCAKLRAAQLKIKTEDEKLRKSDEALRSSHQQLEERVNERTSELLELNKVLNIEIAERKKAEDAIAIERKRLINVLETLPVYVVLLDKDYHVPFANKFFRERFGESHGKRCYEYLFNRQEPCDNCESYKAMKTNAPYHWEWLGPDGHNYDIYDFPFKDTDGSSMIMEMGIDITAQKRAQEELIKHRENLKGLVEERTRKLEDINAQLLTEIAERKEVEEALKESEQRVRIKINSMLSPEGDIGSLELADIIDAKGVQELMDNFYNIAHIPMAIIDVKGKVLVGVGWQDICTKFHRVHPESCQYCIDSDTELSAGTSQGKFKIYKCKNGLWDVATPIMVADKHVGNVFTGQFFLEDESIDYEFFRAQAKKYGFNEEKYLEALKNVSRFSRGFIDTVMTFFLELAGTLSQVSFSNIKLARAVAQREVLTVSLRESETRLNHAQEIAHLGSWELDLIDNKLSWSDEAYRIFGLKPQEFTATYEAFLQVVHPDDRKLVDSAYFSSVREGKDSYEIEHRVVRKSTGEIRYVHERCAHVHDASGKIIRSIGMVQDVTERKKIEDDLKRTNENLEQFAYIASHDLQEPLRIMASYSQLLEKRYKAKLDKDAEDFIAFIVDAAKRMQSLILDLLAYSRVGRFDTETCEVDCNMILGKVILNLRAIIEENKAIITNDTLPVSICNEANFVQLFQNLIANAIKFRRDAPPQIHISAKKEGSEWIFSVSDNGIGIEEKYKERIFLIFQRLHGKDKYPGTGIGLSICKKIVENYGGRIWIESELGKGSTFYFTIPV